MSVLKRANRYTKKDKLSLYKGQINQNGTFFQAEYLRDYISQVLLTDIKSPPYIEAIKIVVFRV
ncbi:conserved hypothetical protein [Acinetobacter sp. 8I-beige]|nr:conserved hypothetical protein [Acinetobacter sp. 8I-beige]